MSTDRRLAVALLIISVVCGTTLVARLEGASAAELQTRSFDPVLSLTGDCSTSAADQVPDPGCPAGAHPPAPFAAPRSIAIDSFGDIYVASYGAVAAGGSEGRIDVFSSGGHFLTEIVDEGGPSSLAIDSEGNLYVSEYSSSAAKISRYAPSVYVPAEGEIEYGSPPVVVAENNPFGYGIAVDSSDGHLFADYGTRIEEFGSSAEGSPLLDPGIGEGSFQSGNSHWVTLDAAHKLLYASDSNSTYHDSNVKVFEAESPHALVRTIDGSTTPAARFQSTISHLSIAVDESDGHVLIDDMERAAKVYEFTEDGEYLSAVTHGFQYVYPSQIAIDNGAHSPNGALNPFGRYLFVPSNETGVGHIFAFAPLQEGPPIVGLLPNGGTTETETQLHGTVNSNGASTQYRFEVVAARQFEESGFAGASVIGEGDLPVETIAREVFASLSGLAAGTEYRFRLFAENKRGEAEKEGTFRTYPAQPRSSSCANEALRSGLSAALPDCRAYELVTPPDTGGRAPYDPNTDTAGDHFGTPTVTAPGDNVTFMTAGGVIPGTDGAGGFFGTPYDASRSPGGWSLESIGMTGGQSSQPQPGGMSADHDFASVVAGGSGSLVPEKLTRYLRYPDGSFHLLGQGSIGSEPRVRAEYVAPDAAHVIFVTGTERSARRLEPKSPPAGTCAIYDRTPDGVTHVVSLLPHGEPPAAGENALDEGTSAYGNAVAFKLEPANSSPLYLRLNDEKTLEVAGPGATFAGVSAEGHYAFFLSGGDLYRFDVSTEATIPITNTHNATVVNTPSSGASAYFVSPSRIAGSGPNPYGVAPKGGQSNLYFWTGSSVRFVGTLTSRDVTGELTEQGVHGGFYFDGLGLWVEAVGRGRFGLDPSRASAEGNVLIFESRASLTGYESGGHAEIYRFDARANTLTCLSCNPTGASALSNANLQAINQVTIGAPQPTSVYALIPNMSASGNRVIFETADPLVPADTDGVQDVYEWEAAGEGSCVGVDGCVYLISSGHSARDNYIYGISDSGADVFFSTTDRLIGADHDETPSIYDARVNGGFPEPSEEDCQGEGCRTSLSQAPTLLAPASPASEVSGNRKACSRGKHRVRRKGKLLCLAKHKRSHAKHRHHAKNDPGPRR